MTRLPTDGYAVGSPTGTHQRDVLLTTRHPYDGPVPYAQDGSLLRRAGTVHEWRPNDPFRRQLTLRPSTRRGTPTYVVWMDASGRRYPMFVTTLAELLLHSTVSQGVTVGWWSVTKRSGSYGICPLRIDGIARS